MPNKPEIITIGDVDYYNVYHLKDYDQVYFYGYVKTPRKIITKRNINNDSYIYATFNEKKNVWTTYDENDKIPLRAVLYI
jgi:hypothetical protein